MKYIKTFQLFEAKYLTKDNKSIDLGHITYDELQNYLIINYKKEIDDMINRKYLNFNSFYTGGYGFDTLMDLFYELDNKN